MTRLLCFAVVMGLSTAAHADSFSFTVGGHHISISAMRNCYSASCVSVSIPGIVSTHRRRSDDVVAARTRPAPKAPATITPVPVVATAPAQQMAPLAPRAETRAILPPPASPPSRPPSAPKLASTDSKEVAAPPPPAEPVKSAAIERPTEPPPPPPPAMGKPPAEQVVDKPPVAPLPPPAVATPAPDPAPAKITKVVDAERDDTPLGDWQTEGKTGAVRIEACGKALCGYLINPSSQAKAETILINMKPKGDVEWRGSIFSRASGNTYNATMTLKRPDLLRVEACALGHFFCSGNNWTRIVKQPAAVLTSRDNESEPPS